MDIGYAPHHESGIQSINDNTVDQMAYGFDGMPDISYVLPYLYNEQIIDNVVFSQLTFMSPQPLNPTTVRSLSSSP